MIQTNRQAVYLPGADICITGHTHDQWVVYIPRETISPRTGELRRDVQAHVKVPTYKDEHAAMEGWHHDRGAPPENPGAWWMAIGWNHSGPKPHFQFLRGGVA